MMPGKARDRAEADRLRGVFEAAGAEVVEFDILQPAETLLDLYGEDIRGRAFVTHDPLRGEMMLRPDFTVPLVSRLAHEGRSAGRFTYAGEVFRRQEDQPDRPSEYLQVGYEVIGADDSAEADAEVFALFQQTLAPLGLVPATGDVGLLRAAVEGLRTTEARRAALLHHLWRPRRFRALLDRFAGRTARRDRPVSAPNGAAEIGLRSRADVEARLARLAAEKAEPPISKGEVELIDALLGVRETMPFALSRLSDIAVDLPAIGDAVDRISARAQALSDRGVDVEALGFEAGYGRTTLEYYDGFVFGFTAPLRPDMPPVATGGRYDALTRALGQAVPAVGGVIRPGLAAALEGRS